MVGAYGRRQTTTLYAEHMASRRRTLPNCGVCGQVQNDHHVLTDFRKPGVLEALRVCAKSGCWEQARALGYELPQKA
jgi:hypothetical protein